MSGLEKNNNDGLDPENGLPEVAGEGFLRRYLPWLISLGVHAMLVLLMVLFYVVYTVVEAKKEVVYPSTSLVDMPNKDLVEVKLSQRSSQKTQRVKIKPTDAVDQRVDKPVSVMIGLGGGSKQKFSPFGKSTGVSDQVQFMGGSGGNATEIVYVIDASGSLIDNLPLVVEELKVSIAKLNPRKQRYTVIFFQDGKAREVEPKGLLLATRKTRRERFKWFDSGQISPSGRSSPVRAIKLGLRILSDKSVTKPLMFILTDNITGRGKWQLEQRKLLGEIRVANKNKVKINTIQFYEPDPLSSQGMEPTLKLIAEESGGVYTEKFARDLKLK